MIFGLLGVLGLLGILGILIIEDASARPPHPEEDCAADGYLRWGAGFLQDFADFCRNLCLISPQFCKHSFANCVFDSPSISV